MNNAQYRRMFETRVERDFIAQHLRDDLATSRLVQLFGYFLLEHENRRLLSHHIASAASLLITYRKPIKFVALLTSKVVKRYRKKVLLQNRAQQWGRYLVP